MASKEQTFFEMTKNDVTMTMVNKIFNGKVDNRRKTEMINYVVDHLLTLKSMIEVEDDK